MCVVKESVLDTKQKDQLGLVIIVWDSKGATPVNCLLIGLEECVHVVVIN